MIQNALRHEINIYKKFNDYWEYGEHIAFYSPNTNEVPHWNLVYRLDGNNISRELFAKNLFVDFYTQRKLVGHSVQFELINGEVSASHSEYFYREYSKIDNDESLSILEFSQTESDCFNDFLHVMNDAFLFDNKTSEYFANKMRMISKEIVTSFFVYYFNGFPVATATTYQNSDGTKFLFNIGVVKAMQGRGFASKLLNGVCSSTKSGIYTYSHNPIMRKSLLPSTGFISIGNVYCVPLKK